MWNARSREVPTGARFEILAGSSPLTFRELFGLLETDDGFARWHAQRLADCGFPAFFWELPPLTTGTFDRPAEFVLLEAPALATLRADSTPFDAQLAQRPDADVITFPNLGGDAQLVVPRLVGPAEAYPHLAAFVRSAPGSQVRALWRCASEVVRESLGTTPRWLSTAGLGVAWLHLRLDSRPKYYRYRPYMTADWRP